MEQDGFKWILKSNFYRVFEARNSCRSRRFVNKYLLTFHRCIAAKKVDKLSQIRSILSIIVDLEGVIHSLKRLGGLMAGELEKFRRKLKKNFYQKSLKNATAAASADHPLTADRLR